MKLTYNIVFSFLMKVKRGESSATSQSDQVQQVEPIPVPVEAAISRQPGHEEMVIDVSTDTAACVDQPLSDELELPAQVSCLCFAVVSYAAFLSPYLPNKYYSLRGITSIELDCIYCRA